MLTLGLVGACVALKLYDFWSSGIIILVLLLFDLALMYDLWQRVTKHWIKDWKAFRQSSQG